jgi:hypothetical protein
MEELLDMAAVHGFYASLLEGVLGHAVPVPHEVAGKDAVAQTADTLPRWLNLLDLAITPLMVRDALKESTSQDTAEALLRHFVRKGSRTDPDRDKTDFIVTFLYRMVVPAEQQIPNEFVVDHPSEFEEELYVILGEDEAASLPEEHRQLVREFPFIRQEVEDFRHFDELMDSGITQRVREIKQRFGPSFYHPRVLATVAISNVFFGRRFDELFRQTAAQIKQFASSIQQQGGSILSRIDGDVTVQHLAEVEEKESEILQSEYGRAQEHFRRISKFKKAVDTRTKAQPQPRVAAAAASMAAASAPGPAHVPDIVEHVPAGISATVEQGKVRSMEDSIRNFVLAADPSSANVVPLKEGNLALTSPEVDAFRALYVGEKSFRADYAAGMRQVVAVQARMTAELQGFSAKEKSAYLWKPHADALTYLLTCAQTLEEQCRAILKVAEQRGLADKSSAMNGSLQKLRMQVQVAARALKGASGS